MGTFANTMFRALLGWLHSAVSGLWTLVTEPAGSSWLHWVLENWLSLTLLLCGAGLVIDFVVYLLRWQPYRVWRRFLHRMKGTAGGEAHGENMEAQLYQRQWVYADGTTSIEDIRRHDQQDLPDLGGDHLELPIRPVRRVARHLPQEQAYYQPVYPPQWQKKMTENQGGNE